MPTTESDNGRIAVGSSSRSVSPALVLTLLAAASFIAALDVWITNVGLPAIKGRRREIPVEPQLHLLREGINALPFVVEGHKTLSTMRSTRSESRGR